MSLYILSSAPPKHSFPRSLKSKLEIDRKTKRICELELEMSVIPQTCYLLEDHPKAVLDEICKMAVGSPETTKIELEMVLGTSKASEICKSYVKDRIAVLNYKQTSTNH